MRLLELYENLFQYLCGLNRLARTPGPAEMPPQFTEARFKVESLIKEAVDRADKAVERHLARQVRAMEQPIVFFVDNMICSSRLDFAKAWAAERLAVKRFNILTGDKDFYTILDRDLLEYSQQRSEEAQERLEVFYVCLGLGFTGIHVTNARQISSYLDQILGAISPWVSPNVMDKLAPDAYESTISGDITKPPKDTIIPVSLAVTGLAVVVLFIYYHYYGVAVEKVEGSIKKITATASGEAGHNDASSHA